MTQDKPESHYVLEDGTWYDATPGSLVATTPVIRYLSDEELSSVQLLSHEARLASSHRKAQTR